MQRFDPGQGGWRSPATQPTVQGIIGLLVGGLLFRGAIAFFLPPGFDEAYYYLYTQHLDWSYFDHPLLVALTTGFGPWLTGQVSQFTIRLGALLLHTASLLLLTLTSVRLFSLQAGILTLAIASLVPIFQLAFGALTLPDGPLMFFWSLSLYLAAQEFFQSPDPLPPSAAAPPLPRSYRPTPRLALLGLLIGLACLGKYHGLALGFGLMGFCCTSPKHRTAFTSRWFLVAIALFLIASAPILFWNWQHDWVSLRFQSGRAIPNQGYNFLQLLTTFLIGVAYLFPSLGFPLWWATSQSLLKLKTSPHHPHSPSHPHSPFPPSHLILWLSLPLILVFTLMGGYRPILPTWAMPGFWGATLLLGDLAATWQEQAPKAVRRWLWGSGWVIVTLLVIALLHLSLGTLQKPSRYAWFGGLIPASADASVQLVDIEQIRQGLAQVPELQAALKQADFVFTSEIFLAGQVGMAIAPFAPPPITCFSEDLRGFAFWSTAEEWVGKQGLYFTSNRLPKASQYTEYFQQINKIGEIPIQRGGAIVEMIQIYQCHNLLKPYPRPMRTHDIGS